MSQDVGMLRSELFTPRRAKIKKRAKKSTQIKIDPWSSPMKKRAKTAKTARNGPKWPEMARNDAKIKKMGFFRKGPSEIF